MTDVNKKIAATLLSTVALMGGTAGTVPAIAQEAPSSDATTAVEATVIEQDYAALGTKAIANVNGTFSYDQSAKTSAAHIATHFAKAAAVLCESLPTYGAAIAAGPIAISLGADPQATLEATVAEIADEEGSESYDMACSCASNGPGGGAIANAEVSGVSLASVLAYASAA